MHRVGTAIGTHRTCEWPLPASSGFQGQRQSQQQALFLLFLFPGTFSPWISFFITGRQDMLTQTWFKDKETQGVTQGLFILGFCFFFPSLMAKTGQLQATYTTVPRVQANSARQPCYEALSLFKCWQDRFLLNLVLFHNYAKGKGISCAWKYNPASVILVSTTQSYHLSLNICQKPKSRCGPDYNNINTLKIQIFPATILTQT